MLPLIRNLTKKQAQLNFVSKKGFQSTNYLYNRIEIFVDDIPIKVDPQYTIFQACHEAGVIVPRFCYHERLSVAGNCRMCLVEVEKSPKPVAACTAQVMPGMRIKTSSEKTRVHRGSVMEFLLANHPLDCPICDQGGECDLQDIAQVYGYGEGRYREYKRAVQDKNLGPLISTHMNRCIHCTRCIRFASEIAGVYDLGQTGRGKNSEIGTYVEQMVSSELSGNLVDICPVGALTNGPYAYTSRPWELKGYYSIDVLDGLGQNIQVDTRGAEIMRVLPRINEEVNQEWLDDKARHAFDGLKRQRLTNPLRRNKEGNFENIEWEDAITSIAQKLANLSGNDVAGVIGDKVDIETVTAFKDLLNRLDSDNFHFTGKGNLAVDADFRSNYIMNSQITGVEDTDLLLLVGTNPKYEAPVFNARILKAVNNNKLKVFTIGSPFDLSYPTIHLGNSASILADIASGKHPFAQRLLKAKLPMIITNSTSLERSDGEGILNNLKTIAKNSPVVNKQTGWNGFNILHREASRVGALDIGIKQSSPENLSKAKFVFLLGADNNLRPEHISKDSFVVYLGTHGDEGAYYADLVLPGAAYTEQNSTFANTEGRVQLTRLAVTSPGNAKDDWEVLRAISEELGISLPYDTLEELRFRMAELAPHLMKYDYIEPTVLGDISLRPGSNTQINNTPLIDQIDNFYQTDSISRSSVTMAKCSTAFNQDKFSNFRN